MDGKGTRKTREKQENIFRKQNLLVLYFFLNVCLIIMLMFFFVDLSGCFHSFSHIFTSLRSQSFNQITKSVSKEEKKNIPKKLFYLFSKNMPPTLKVADFMPVDLSTGPVLFATYSPSISTQQHDVTQKVRHLQMTKSRSEIANLQGGIHCHIGDPFPNISKCFRVWFANKPDQTFIIDTQSSSHALMQQKVFISPAMQIVAASYSAEPCDLPLKSPSAPAVLPA